MNAPTDDRPGQSATPASASDHYGRMKGVLAEAANRYFPGPDAKKRLDSAVDRLMERARSVAKQRKERGLLAFEPILVGSAAKDTWLPGHVDLDVFLLFDPSVPWDRMEEEGLAAGHEILDEAHLRYAEHPYVVGPFEGFEADIVPAYKVASGAEIQSSVDRTPFHNAWVKEKIRQNPGLTTEIRLLKAWLRGVGVYGAKTAQRGISGYLSEVLTIHHGGFLHALEAAQGFREGTRIDPTGQGTAGHPTEPLVVVDPVDPSRNAAAAVRIDRLETMARAAAEFLTSPSIRFFDPAPLVPPRLEAARQSLGSRGIVVVLFDIPDMNEDDRDPHLERAASTLGRQLERAGFRIQQTWGGVTGDRWSVLAVLATETMLPRTRIHIGPPVGIGSRRDDFVAKYKDHPDAMEEPFETEYKGKRHVAVRLRQRDRGLEEQTKNAIQGISLGKHADTAIRKGKQILGLEAALAEPSVAKVVAQLLVQRPPWSRIGHPMEDYVPTWNAAVASDADVNSDHHE